MIRQLARLRFCMALAIAAVFTPGLAGGPNHEEMEAEMQRKGAAELRREKATPSNVPPV